MEDDRRGIKLLGNLQHAFQKDPDIDEYDFIPVLEPKSNCNPIILENHKLGMELWAAKLLFAHAYTELFRNCNGLNIRSTDAARYIQLTRAVLLMNADNATAWNIRKRLIKKKYLCPEEDLKFGALIVTKHPKSPETFAHRKWVIQQLQHRVTSNEIIENLGFASGSSESNEKLHNRAMSCEKNDNEFRLSTKMQDIVNKELDTCTISSAKYPNNYNSWSHRIWLVKDVCHCNKEILHSELKFTSSWMLRNKSDYSGYHYRQFVLDALFNFSSVPHKHSSEVCSVLSKEINETAQDIRDFPGHETLWCHRKFAVQTLLKHLRHTGNSVIQAENDAPMNCEVAPKKSKLDLSTDPQGKYENENLTCESILQNERLFANSIMECAGKQFVPEWQRTLGTKHKCWLDRISNKV